MERLLHWIPPGLAKSALARRLVNALFLGGARRQAADFDQVLPARAQIRILLGLIHQAQNTRFGRDHDFHRIRSAEDFRRLVPLRTPAALWREYWQPAFPDLAGASWPGPIANLAVPELWFTGPFPCVPVSPALGLAFRQAVWTALALVTQARPQARLFEGRLLLLGDGTAVNSLADPIRAGSWDVLAAQETPPVLRSYLYSAAHLNGRAGPSTEERFAALARGSLKLPITCLAGSAHHLLRFFAHLKQLTGRNQVAEVWPGLVAVLFTPSGSKAGRAQLQREVGQAAGAPPVLFLEAWFQPEGAIALEDPRHNCLRLLADHGVYFEFVPMEQLGKPQPVRHGVADVEPGVRYALAMTSPAGLWACLLGMEVCFERCNPPLLRIVPLRSLPQPAPVAVPVPALAPRSMPHFPLQPPRRPASKLGLPLLKQR